MPNLKLPKFLNPSKEQKRKILLFFAPRFAWFAMWIIYLFSRNRFDIDSRIADSNAIFIAWHGELLMLPFLYRKIKSSPCHAIKIAFESATRESNKDGESMIENRNNKSDSTLRHCDSNNLDSRGLDSSLQATLFAQNDDEIILYTHPNNTNLTPPKIDYIIFLDSDDFWESDLLESCVRFAQKYSAEIVWFSWQTFYDGLPNPSGGGAQTLLG